MATEYLTDREVAVIIDCLAKERESIKRTLRELGSPEETPNIDGAIAKINGLMTPSQYGLWLSAVDPSVAVPPPTSQEIDPQDLTVAYGERRLGEATRYVLATRMFRPDGSRVGLPRTVIFESDSKSEVIAEAQRRKGWEPVDGSERTYAQQIQDHVGEAR